MNKLMDLVKKAFTYNPLTEYNFSLPNVEQDNNPAIQESSEVLNIKDVSTSESKNLEYVKAKYNVLINSDIVTREFVINATGKQYKAFILYIDGMIDSKILNEFVLKPLMLRNKNSSFNTVNENQVISKHSSNNANIRKVKKTDLATYIENCLIPQNSIKKSNSFEDIFCSVNSGDCALFIDTLDIAFDIDIKGFKQREITRAENEVVIKGSHEAFVENIRTNTSLLRRLTHSENLIIEKIDIGKITKTNCAVCYMQNIANSDLVAEVKYRINNLDIDYILSTGQLEQLINNNNYLGLPKAISTERPDNATQNLLEGRVVILMHGSPYCLIVPAIIGDFITSPEDRNLKPVFANFLRFIRILASFFALLLPGLYVSVTSFHIEILPTELLFSILSARDSVPFPIIFEILIMEISFEIIREASLRVPTPIGSTIGIVGGLVLRSSCC